MNKFQKDLLNFAYENYLKTGEVYFKFAAKNDDDLTYYTDAAANLSEMGYINPKSSNIFDTTINIVPTLANIICYEITNSGLILAEKHCQTEK